MVTNSEKEKIPARIILTRGLIARLDSLAAERTTSRSLLVRLACEQLIGQIGAGAKVSEQAAI